MYKARHHEYVTEGDIEYATYQMAYHKYLCALRRGEKVQEPMRRAAVVHKERLNRLDDVETECAMCGEPLTVTYDRHLAGKRTGKGVFCTECRYERVRQGLRAKLCKK